MENTVVNIIFEASDGYQLEKIPLNKSMKYEEFSNIVYKSIKDRHKLYENKKINGLFLTKDPVGKSALGTREQHINLVNNDLIYITYILIENKWKPYNYITIKTNFCFLCKNEDNLEKLKSGWTFCRICRDCISKISETSITSEGHKMSFGVFCEDCGSVCPTKPIKNEIEGYYYVKCLLCVKAEYRQCKTCNIPCQNRRFLSPESKPYCYSCSKNAKDIVI